MPEEKENTKNTTELAKNTSTGYKSNRKKRIAKTKSFSSSNEKAKKFKGMPTVIGREAEFRNIKKQLDSFIKYKINNVLYLTGVPGSGKTHTTLTLLNFLEIPFSYINCSTLKTKREIYKEMCNSIECTEDLANGSLQTLRFHMTKCSNSHVIVIDEIDFLKSKNEIFLYNLFEMPFIENCKVFIIAISNTLGSLSSKLESRIAKNRIEFRPYTSEQLMSVTMLENQNGKIDKKSLELITKRIASSTGDIRKVKEIIDQSENLNLNTTIHILKDMSTPLLNKFVASMNFYQKLVLHLNTSHLKSIFAWFDDFKSFCKIKNYPILDFADFRAIVEELISFDIYKIKNDGMYVVCNFLQEEMEIALKNDKVFNEFKSGKAG